MKGLSRLGRKVRRAILRDEPTYYDMFENKGERYFARLYLSEIQKVIREFGPQEERSLKILDAGCQSGRLAIPLSREGHQVIGVDSSAVGLRRLRRHAQEQGSLVHSVRANLTHWLPNQPTGSFDAVVCTEVLYLRDNHRTLLEELIRLLKEGGLCFIAHRPTGYYLAEAFQRRDWEAVRLLLSSREGVLWGSYYNWQDQRDLESLYRELGIEVLAIAPIGFLSWLAVNPEDLDETGQDLLFETEIKSRHRFHGSGRYLLVSGRKQHS